MGILRAMNTRRNFIASALCCAGAMVAPAPLAAAAAPIWKERTLWLARQDASEQVRVPFCIDGLHVYAPGYRQLCWVLRDLEMPSNTGYVGFSIQTLEALWEVQQVLALHGVRRPITITSGYRAPQTNARILGADQNSQHLRATAVDMYVEGVPMSTLYSVCYSRPACGGIGYYGGHVHLDTGPRRYWSGSGP